MKFKPHFFHKTVIGFLIVAIFFTACDKTDTEINSENDSEKTLTTPGDSRVSMMAANLPPHPKTGPDQTTTLPKDSVTLNASGSFDEDGTIVSYLWTKDFGSGSTIVSPNSALTVIRGLTAGAYRYKLTVTDNGGATVTDTIRITVVGGSGNQNPTVSAGADKSVTLPTRTTTLQGTASDPDGSIVSYLWTKLSGVGGSVASPNNATTSITGLLAGPHVYNLKVTDNQGATANSIVNVTVNPAGTPNQSPVVTTGASQSITLPVSSVTLTGSATDADGTIASYLWTKVSGPAGGTITSPASTTTTVTGLTAGSYVFNLRATDNAGAAGNKTATVTVNAALPNQNPVVTVSGPITITLPVSIVTLTGSATDPDGTIVSYLWTKVSGTGSIILTPNAATTIVTTLLGGSYVFNLKATDNAGGSTNKTVTVNVSSAIPPPPAGYTLTFSSGYDTQADMTYGGSSQYGNGTISTSIYKTGPGSFYSRPSPVSAGIRSEVQYNGTAQNPSEGAIEYDVLYEVIIPSNGCSLQWHPYSSESSGSPFLLHDGGKFTWVVWNNGQNTYYPTGITIQTQRWYRLRVEFKFGTPAQGAYLRWFVDGVKVLDKPNIQMGDGSGQYLKVGYNGWDANSANSRIYYDNLKVYKKS